MSTSWARDVAATFHFIVILIDERKVQTHADQDRCEAITS